MTPPSRILGLALGLTLACGASLPPRFVSERDQAIAAYAQGSYRDAAAHWRNAASLAPDERERDEAVFREATCLERAGDRAAAEAIYATLEQGHGERAARAAFARAESVLGRGDEAAGYELLARATLRFPSSGPARGGAGRVIDHAREQGGAAAERREIERFLAGTAGSELEESLLFRRARWLEQNATPAEAAAAYRDVATRYPFPRGIFWDDSVVALARLDEQAGRYREAVAGLEDLLKHRDEASLTGSYERTSYAEARFHIAELYRDKLGDPARARAEFRRVFTDHPTSRLSDDALFEEALVAFARHDAAGACEPMQLLLGKRAESRYAPCAHALCPDLSTKGECRSYIDARIRRAANPDAGADAPPDDDYSSSSR
jgi:tetratricopeptide (TPR) repeat protein